MPCIHLLLAHSADSAVPQRDCCCYAGAPVQCAAPAKDVVANLITQAMYLHTGASTVAVPRVHGLSAAKQRHAALLKYLQPPSRGNSTATTDGLSHALPHNPDVGLWLTPARHSRHQYPHMCTTCCPQVMLQLQTCQPSTHTCLPPQTYASACTRYAASASKECSGSAHVNDPLPAQHVGVVLHLSNTPPGMQHCQPMHPLQYAAVNNGMQTRALVVDVK